MGARFLIPASVPRDGQGNEGNESHGCHEGNEGHEEEAHLCTPFQASRLLWQIDKSKSGLKKSDLVQNKHGRVVSKKNHLRGKQSPWIAAVQKARKELKIKGFSVIKKGTPLYKKAKELYGQ